MARKLSTASFSTIAKSKEFNIYLTTWNVSGAVPPDDLFSLFGLDVSQPSETLPDLFAIGLQEINIKPQAIITDSLFINPWTSAISNILCKKNYVRLSSVRLLGIFLVVFVKRNHVPRVTSIQTNYTRTGLAGVWGNKGGVSISLNLYERSVCITNCHLAAHMSGFKERIADCESIVDSQVFRDVSESIIEHDYLFWMGDLNFRIDDLEKEDVKRLVESHNYEHLLQHDQLTSALKSENIFNDFREAKITFPPTYKFDKGSDLYDTSIKNRKPAWCDRILWRINSDPGDLCVKKKSYHCHPEFKISDHKPVSALFNIRVANVKYKLITFIFTSEPWKVDCVASCHFKVDARADVTNWDWIGLYKADFEGLEEYETYVWAVTENLPSDSSLNGVVNISKQYIRNEGMHRLLYISKKYECAFGMSEPFEILA